MHIPSPRPHSSILAIPVCLPFSYASNIQFITLGSEMASPPGSTSGSTAPSQRRSVTLLFLSLYPPLMSCPSNVGEK